MMRRGRRAIVVLTLLGAGLMSPPAGAQAPDAAAPLDPASWIASSWCPGDPGRLFEDDADATTGAPDVKVVYVYAADKPNRFAAFADEMQRSVSRMAQLVGSAPGSAKSLRFDLGTPCGPQYADIRVAQLPGTAASYTSSTDAGRATRIAQDLRQAGVLGAPGHATRRYLIYADQLFTGSANGTTIGGTDDPNPGPQNAANQDEALSVYWGYTDPPGCELNGPGACGGFGSNGADYLQVDVALHELFHGLGAVNSLAPHAAGQQHCNQGNDLMCQQVSPISTVCGTGPEDLIIDCQQDDYFAPTGTILGRTGTPFANKPIWNTYDSVFLCAKARCANAAPVPRVTGPATVTAGTPLTLDAAASTDDDGITAYAWDLDGDGSFETPTGSTPRVTTTPGAAGTLRPAVRVIDTDGAARTASLAVTVTAPPAGGPPAGGATPPTGTAPPGTTSSAKTRLSALKLAATTFRRLTGVRVSFTLSRAAAVRVRVERRGRGTRFVPLPGTLTVKGRSGSNRLTVKRLRGRLLKAGTYRLALTVGSTTTRTKVFRVR